MYHFHMWILYIGVAIILLGVFVLDHQIRRNPGKILYTRLASALFVLSLTGLLATIVIHPKMIAGILLAFACGNAFVACQRAAALMEAQRIKNDPEFEARAAETPYEQFVNTFFSYFDRGEADTLEFEFRQWRMEIRFKKGAREIPVTTTPFHILLQIKRLFDAATATNPKTGESKMRYVSRNVFYEFSPEDVGGTILRLRLIHKRPATTEEVSSFEKLLSSVR